MKKLTKIVALTTLLTAIPVGVQSQTTQKSTIEKDRAVAHMILDTVPYTQHTSNVTVLYVPKVNTPDSTAYELFIDFDGDGKFEQQRNMMDRGSYVQGKIRDLKKDQPEVSQMIKEYKAKVRSEPLVVKE